MNERYQSCYFQVLHSYFSSSSSDFLLSRAKRLADIGVFVACVLLCCAPAFLDFLTFASRHDCHLCHLCHLCRQGLRVTIDAGKIASEGLGDVQEMSDTCKLSPARPELVAAPVHPEMAE